MNPYNTDRFIGENPALLVIDPQRDFVHPDGEIYCGHASEGVDPDGLADRINDLVATGRESDIPIIWSKERHRPDGADRGTELMWDNATHTTCGTWGEEFIDDLDVNVDDLEPAEYTVDKRRYNLFHGTDLGHLLRVYDIDTVVLTGVTTSVCVHYTAQGALERDYVFRTVEECTADETPELHQAGLRCQDHLQPNGVVALEAIRDEFVEYEGNPTVAEVKSESMVSVSSD